MQDASAPRGVEDSQTAPRDFLGTSEAAALERSCGQKLQQAPMYNIIQAAHQLRRIFRLSASQPMFLRLA